MKGFTAEEVIDLSDQFSSDYAANISNGLASIEFANCENQWDRTVVSERALDGKESLTFPLITRTLNKLKAEYDKLQFSLSLSELESSQFSHDEISAYKALFNSFISSDEAVSKFSDTWSKGIEFGYTFMEVTFGRENENSLNLVPKLKYKADPTIAFWANDGEKKTKIDCSYAGYRMNVSDETLKSECPKISKSKKIKLMGEEGNDVVYFWRRAQDTCFYIEMDGGEYIREDLVDMSDPEQYDRVSRNELGLPNKKEGSRTCVYFSLIVNGKTFIKDSPWPTSHIPLPYWHGRTEWTKSATNGASNQKASAMTKPITYSLMGAQKVHNYAWSQVATNLKSQNSRTFILNPDHVQSELQKINAQNLNNASGPVILGTGSQTPGQVNQPMIIDAPETAQTLLEVIRMSAGEMDDLVGAVMEEELSDSVSVSGVALDKITKNRGLKQTNPTLIKAQVEYLSDVALLVQEMMPNICNNRLPTGKVLNDISKLIESYSYKITVSPTDEMQTQSSLQAMSAFYQLPPTEDVAATKHLFAYQLPIQRKDEFIKLITANMDPLLMSYQDGEISQQQYAQQKQQQAQQGAMMQQQQMQQQLQAQNIMAQAEQVKSSAIQYNAESKRMKDIADAQNDNDKIQADLVKYGGKQQLDIAQHQLSVDQHSLDIIKESAAQFQSMQDQNNNQGQQPPPPQAQNQQGISANDAAQ
jgi:hypothetical protein